MNINSDLNPTPEKKELWIFKRGVVIAGLVIFGPFALPLMLISSHFSLRAKIIVTAVAAVLAYLSYQYTPMLIDSLMKQYETVLGARQF